MGSHKVSEAGAAATLAPTTPDDTSIPPELRIDAPLLTTTPPHPLETETIPVPQGSLQPPHGAQQLSAMAVLVTTNIAAPKPNFKLVHFIAVSSGKIV
jgi:hypothetical protein